MTTPRKTRGEYRPIYETLFHGKDFRRLSPAAKLCLLTIKGLSGAAGIKPWAALADTLAELTGHPIGACRTASRELIAANWIEYDDGIVWVVRGLEFEPQMSTGEKHRAYLEKVMESLPRAPIVSRFRAHYAAFFGNSPSDTLSGTLSGRVPIAHRRAFDSPCDTTTPSPSPTLSPSLSNNDDVVVVADPDHRRRLAVAANKGISEQFGEQPTPVLVQHPGTTACAEALAAAGVPLVFAESKIFEIARDKQPADGKPATSLRWFESAVVRAWQAEQAHREAATAADPTAPKGDPNDPRLDLNYHTAVRYAKLGNPEWQEWCTERGVDWAAA